MCRCLRLGKVCIPHIPKSQSERVVKKARKSVLGRDSRSQSLGGIVEHALLSQNNVKSPCAPEEDSAFASAVHTSHDLPPALAESSAPMASRPSESAQPSIAQRWPRASLGATILNLFDQSSTILNQQVLEPNYGCWVCWALLNNDA